jgi:hypothetical protein
VTSCVWFQRTKELATETRHECDHKPFLSSANDNNVGVGVVCLVCGPMLIVVAYVGSVHVFCVQRIF